MKSKDEIHELTAKRIGELDSRALVEIRVPCGLVDGGYLVLSQYPRAIVRYPEAASPYSWFLANVSRIRVKE